MDLVWFILYNQKLTFFISVQCKIKILDAEKRVVTEFNNCMGTEKVSNIKLWWPYLMDPIVGYMYTMDIKVQNMQGTDSEEDVFQVPFGIRTVEWNATNLLVNGRPFYFRGFGKHEDSDIRGKGLDLPLISR